LQKVREFLALIEEIGRERYLELLVHYFALKLREPTEKRLAGREIEAR
jgi:hypothetical protein